MVDGEAEFKTRVQTRLKVLGQPEIKGREELSDFVLETIRKMPMQAIRNLEKANLIVIQLVLGRRPSVA